MVKSEVEELYDNINGHGSFKKLKIKDKENVINFYFIAKGRGIKSMKNEYEKYQR